MPRRIPTIRIVPEVLAWARESAGLSQQDLSRRIKTGQVNVPEWERPGSETLVTASQLEKIADAVKRPTAALLLEFPPEEPMPPRDFRRLSGRPDRYSPDLSRVVRRVRRLQRIAAEVFRALNESVESRIPSTFTVSDVPDDAASETRDRLHVPSDIHVEWRNPSEALRGWRAIIEDQNILVFGGDFPRDEAQGFSLSDAQPNVIALSNKDAPSARCFTLWHEYGHLLLRNTGLCLIDDPSGYRFGDHPPIEDWCNRFAEAMLIPRSSLDKREHQVTAIVHRRAGYESALSGLAGHFRISQHVALFRMWHLGLLSNERFWWEFDRVQKEQQEAALERELAVKSRPARQMGRNVPNEVVRGSGQRLAKALLQAFDRQKLTHAELADYFGARLKHLDNIRREAHR